MLRWGRWEEIRKLGAGGQGTAYLVRDTSAVNVTDTVEQLRQGITGLGDIRTIDDAQGSALAALQAIESYLHRDANPHVAVLKILHDPARTAAKAIGRLKLEVEVLSALDHPNLLTIVDADVGAGWYVAPYHRGGTLADNLSSYEGDPQATLRALIPLIEGIALLHAKGVVHRDIKPENIFLSDGQLVLGDFGIVRWEDAGQTRLSESYENVGSRDWMPGWAMGKLLDDVRPSFDVFSLGKVLWAMVSGRTMMQLWYFDQKPFDLRDQFPQDERIPWIHQLLSKSVREHESDVWRNATEMAAEMKRVADSLRRGGQVFGTGFNHLCRVCGRGIYKLAVADANTAGLKNLGLRPAGETLRVFNCTYCGHLDVFRITFSPPAWNS
jgi:serine/threonine protein kinase